MVSESYPESCLNHTSNFPILNVGRLPEQNLCFVSTNLFFATTGHGLCLLLLLRKIRQQRHPAAAPCSGTLQRHPAAAPCNGTNMPTPKRTRAPLSLQHPKAAPCSGTADQLQSAQATPIPAPCSSSVQQHPTLAPLQHPQAPPLRHHQQASSTAPSSSSIV